MKKLLLLGVLLFAGVTAKAQTDQIEIERGRVWACGMKFKGVSKGLQFIVGKFGTRAYGTLSCASIHGETYKRKVRIDISSYKVGPTIGAGYFKMAGVSSEISLFNEHPESILGKYSVTNYQVAVGGGAGYFTATKLGLPQLAYNVSVQLLGGLGLKVGIEKLRITAID
ncbi:hypothetical protein [Bdellovibrio sp. HCB2-146]|uniref:hypothetical protein n=1 Tax=Bdellovibrio sp. HCB2-146 TaxID=3394362 RepID=UPI0039BC369E